MALSTVRKTALSEQPQTLFKFTKIYILVPRFPDSGIHVLNFCFSPIAGFLLSRKNATSSLDLMMDLDSDS